ncbi:MAG TPA: hypothetical protein VF980_15830 [Thermoanaerobaculia bacterium]
MIYRNADFARNITWHPEISPEAPARARQFLDGERELFHLARGSREVTALDMFLETATDLAIDRGVTGEILVRATNCGESLLLTGKTASVLRSYIDDEPVSTRDRLDMTLRRRAFV